MFLSRDAVGLLVIFLFLSVVIPWRGYLRLKSVCFSLRNQQGKVGVVRGHDCVPVDAGWRCSLAGLRSRTNTAGDGTGARSAGWGTVSAGVLGSSFDWRVAVG